MEEFDKLCGEDGIKFGSLVTHYWVSGLWMKETNTTLLTIGFSLDIDDSHPNILHLKHIIAACIISTLSGPIWNALDTVAPIFVGYDGCLGFRLRTPERHLLKTVEAGRLFATEIQNVELKKGYGRTVLH